MFKYIFGNKEFIGMVKFYDNKKDFGFIVSNNYGMSGDEKFKEENQSFFFSKRYVNGVFPAQFKLVVFKPIINNSSKTIAADIRLYSVDNDRELAIDYIHNNNYISYKEKETHWKKWTQKEVVYKDVTINIFKKSGISRYESLNNLCYIYKEKGCTEFMSGLDELIKLIGGDETYYKCLRDNYPNKENEHNAILELFGTIDEQTSVLVVSKHKAFQHLAPKNILVKAIDSLDRNYGIPKNIMPLYNEHTILGIIESDQVLRKYHNIEDSQNDRRIGFRPKQTTLMELLNACPIEHIPSLKEIIANQLSKEISIFLNERTENMHLWEYKRVYEKYRNLFNSKLLKQADEIANKKYVEDIQFDISKLISCRNNEDSYALEFESYFQTISGKFYRANDTVKEKSKDIIVDGYKKFIEENFKHGWIFSTYRMDSQAFQEFFDSDFVNEFCSKELKCVYKEDLEKLCHIAIFRKDDEKTLFEMTLELCSDEEINKLFENLAYDAWKHGTLSNVCRLYVEYFGKELPNDVLSFVEKMSVESILDSGVFFFNLNDKGMYLRDIVFNKIYNTTNVNGDFIASENENDYLMKSLFFCSWIHALGYDKLDEYISKLSGHDRVMIDLRLIRELDITIGSPDDYRYELLRRGVDGDIDKISSLEFGMKAIINIITSFNLSSPSNLSFIVLWLKRYLSIKDRVYRDRNSYESKLIDYLFIVENVYHVSFSVFGISTKERTVIPSVSEYDIFDSFLKNIWKCSIEVTPILCLQLSKDSIKEIKPSLIMMLEKICGGKLNTDTCQIKLSNALNDIDEKYLIAIMTVNMLNNIKALISCEDEKLSIERLHNDEKIISIIYSLINMEARDGMEAFWRVGDRPDLEFYYRDVKIEFEYIPSNKMVCFLNQILPGIKVTENPLVYFYEPYVEHEENRGYGRSYDYDNSEKYKDEVFTKITKELFYAYKSGYGMDHAQATTV